MGPCASATRSSCGSDRRTAPGTPVVDRCSLDVREDGKESSPGHAPALTVALRIVVPLGVGLPLVDASCSAWRCQKYTVHRAWLRRCSCGCSGMAPESPQSRQGISLGGRWRPALSLHAHGMPISGSVGSSPRAAGELPFVQPAAAEAVGRRPIAGTSLPWRFPRDFGRDFGREEMVGVGAVCEPKRCQVCGEKRRRPAFIAARGRERCRRMAEKGRDARRWLAISAPPALHQWKADQRQTLNRMGDEAR